MRKVHLVDGVLRNSLTGRWRGLQEGLFPELEQGWIGVLAGVTIFEPSMKGLFVTLGPQWS